jgi:hypothetical protein
LETWGFGSRRKICQDMPSFRRFHGLILLGDSTAGAPAEEGAMFAKALFDQANQRR